MKHNDPRLLLAVKVAARLCHADESLLFSKRRMQAVADARALVIRYLMDEWKLPMRKMLELFKQNHPAIYLARERAKTGDLAVLYGHLKDIMSVDKPSPAPVKEPEPAPVLPPKPASEAGFGNLWG